MSLAIVPQDRSASHALPTTTAFDDLSSRHVNNAMSGSQVGFAMVAYENVACVPTVASPAAWLSIISELL